MQLRAIEPHDIDLLYTIENDHDLWDVSSVNVPYSRYDLEQYILSQRHDLYSDRQLRLVITADDGKAVGLIDLFDFSPANSRTELGIAILKEERGKGYAAGALKLLHAYAASHLHIHQIYAIVPSDNATCLAMLRSMGYASERVLPDWVQTSYGYIDCIALFKVLE